MAKLSKAKKKVTTRKTVAKTRVIVPGEDFRLPSQAKSEIQLVETDPNLLLAMAKPNEFRDALQKAKEEFVNKVELLSALCDIKVDVRAYFTFNVNPKGG